MPDAFKWMTAADLQNMPSQTPQQRRTEDERKALMVYKLVREIATNNSPRETVQLLFGKKLGPQVPGSGYLADYIPRDARKYIGR